MRGENQPIGRPEWVGPGYHHILATILGMWWIVDVLTFRNFYKDLLKLQYERMTVGEKERDKSLKLYGGSMAGSEFERLIWSG